MAKSRTSTTTTTSTTTSSGGGGSGSACYVYPDTPATPGIVTPDVVYERSVYMNGSMTMDDGTVVPIWGFVDTATGAMGGMDASGPFPSPPMRINVGTIVHTKLTVPMMNGIHTIHHHGIEPADHSDGVGHVTWDVNGTYTYQWRPMSPGTYFYHCHTNTVLHAEMGMYGALIVDPPEGPGTLLSGGPTYNMEAFWVVDEIDTRWHNKSWSAGTCGTDEGFHLLEPDYFIITGVDGSGTSAMNLPPISANMQVGQKCLARYVCAGYHPQHIRIPAGLHAKAYISDGRALPTPMDAGSFKAISGERYDIILEPDQPGEYIVEFDIVDWITGNVWGTVRTNVVVTG
ncbi:MAG: multicopper oxidase domain-containing protein [Gammaproteobacteria bacterium]|nr:multicopper oxidase domain-containing protein [Gammaproteobacteria bacterium]MDH5650301.1 multicopper oxidase domain-containing protein [Gammaproteobacteria bacterium]